MKINFKYLVAGICTGIFLVCNFLSYGLTIIPACKDSSLQKKANQLEDVYQQTVNASGAKRDSLERIFFGAFPSNFSEFNAIYGTGKKNPYDGNDTGNPAPLYTESGKHLALFEQIRGISDTIYMIKLVDIATGGHWDADAISLFQQLMIKKSLKDANLLFGLLTKQNEKNVKSFWLFYFDGPHPPKEYPKEFDAFNTKYKKIFDSMKKSLDEIQKLRREH